MTARGAAATNGGSAAAAGDGGEAPAPDAGIIDGAEVRLPTAEATREWGRTLAGILRAGDLVVLTGELGAGKTTLAQGVGRGLGVRGPILSPTFVIARVHPSLVGGPALVHVDAYRLATLEDVDLLDLDASLDESVTLVEWGKGMVEHLAASRLEIHLIRARGASNTPGAAGAATADDDGRIAFISAVGPRWSAVPRLGVPFAIPFDG